MKDVPPPTESFGWWEGADTITTSAGGHYIHLGGDTWLCRLEVAGDRDIPTGRIVTRSSESSAEAQHTFERQPLGENPSALDASVTVHHVSVTVHHTEPARVPPQRSAELIPPPPHLAAFAETRRGPPAGRVQSNQGVAVN